MNEKRKWLDWAVELQETLSRSQIRRLAAMSGGSPGRRPAAIRRMAAVPLHIPATAAARQISE